MGVEGLFMEWIVRALKPNGKAFVVVPDGIFNRQNDKNLRKFILDECILDGIISLPLKTFFTTPKKTYILCLTKKANKKDIQTEPVFTYLVSEIGESRDIYRFNIEQNDLKEAVNLYSFFKGNKTNFEKINKDTRCKIQPIEKFNPEIHWSIDRWWTKEEKISLGIEEEDKSINVAQFGELVDEIADTLKEYSTLLKEVSEKKKIISSFQKISLVNKNYFDLFIGKRLVKRDLINITGNIPIYSANVKVPISFHNKSNISDFSNNFVIWGIDGDFEYNFIPKNTTFVTTDHCGTIRILVDEMLPEYLMIQLEKAKHKYGFDRGLRSSLSNMQTVFVEIPFDENGNIDTEKQQEIIEKYQCVKELKSKIENYKKQIQELNVELENDLSNVTNKKVSELFNIEKGKAIYTNKFILDNKGIFPLYSSQTINDGIIGKINKFDYDDQAITWTTDGIHAGTVFLRNNKFSMTTHCGALFLKEESKNIHLDYIYSYLKSCLKNDAIGEQNKRVTKEIIQNIQIPLPIKPNGEFDLEAQKAIAKKYKKIEQVKESLSEELDKMLKMEVDYE